jgi:hypothetical protein
MLIQVRQEVTIIERGSGSLCRCDDSGPGFVLEVVQALPAAAVLLIEVAGRVVVGAAGCVLRVGAVALVLVAGVSRTLAPLLDSAGRSAVSLALTKGGTGHELQSFNE